MTKQAEERVVLDVSVVKIVEEADVPDDPGDEDEDVEDEAGDHVVVRLLAAKYIKRLISSFKCIRGLFLFR